MTNSGSVFVKQLLIVNARNYTPESFVFHYKYCEVGLSRRRDFTTSYMPVRGRVFVMTYIRAFLMEDREQ